MPNTLYERDFYAWANEQASLLRSGNLSIADIENIAEEIASMGRSENRELVNRLVVLLTHLLKWAYQPSRQSPSWESTIWTQRGAIERHMRDNPSLTAKLDEAIGDAYRDARKVAAAETRLKLATIPPECPWTFDQIMAEEFWPSV